MAFLSYLFFIVIASYGFSIILVEKRKQWPVRMFNILIKKKLRIINRKLSKMLDCTVCTSFWATLLIELICLPILFILGCNVYFVWPISGFITAGITWTIMDILISIAAISDSIESKK